MLKDQIKNDDLKNNNNKKIFTNKNTCEPMFGYQPGKNKQLLL